MPVYYTKEEGEAINRAFNAIEYACERTNWTDKPRLREALKLERKQAAPDQEMPLTWAKGRVCKLFFEGYTKPETPAHVIADHRPGALGAFLLGASLVQRYSAETSGPIECIKRAVDLCPAAIEALEAQFNRYLERI